MSHANDPRADISYVDQLNLILGVLGTPDEETLKRMSSDKARAYLNTLPHHPRTALEDVFPDAEHDGESLCISTLLTHSCRPPWQASCV